MDIWNHPDTIYFNNITKNGYECFSNSYIYPFKICNIVFNCIEQYIQWYKMVMFGKDEIALRILQTNNPTYMKALARCKKASLTQNELKNWSKVSYEVMKIGIEAKFSQNPNLMIKLIETRKRPLVEKNINFLISNNKFWTIRSNQYENKPILEKIELIDTISAIWGVNSRNIGCNYLGKILMEIREY